MNIKEVKNKVLSSQLFKDSFWAVFGNGFGNAMLLLAGILIARLLGKDIYGEYGVVKTTMFYVASFATFGLGFTSTKYIAQYVRENKEYLKCIVRDSLEITLSFSGVIAILLLVFAQPLAEYVNEPKLKVAFQALSIVVVFKAVTTTQIGILSGFKVFNKTARNTCLSGVFMLIICVPLTYFWGLKGSLFALLSSQVFNSILNYLSIYRILKQLDNQLERNFKKELVSFSFPVALQESSYTVCHWTAVMLLTKYASVGELGLYSVGAQWNSIVLMIPSLLSNVVLSYLSSSAYNVEEHRRTVNRMIIINFTTTLLPFSVVYVFADLIARFYGPTFTGLPSLMRIMVFATILESCSSVFKSELMAKGHTWLLFTLRSIRDALFVGVVYYMFAICHVSNGAICYAWCFVTISIIFFLSMWSTYLLKRNKV